MAWTSEQFREFREWNISRKENRAIPLEAYDYPRPVPPPTPRSPGQVHVQVNELEKKIGELEMRVRKLEQQKAPIGKVRLMETNEL